MNAEDLKATTGQIIEILAPYTDEGRQRIIAELGAIYCLLCWTKLEGRKCYCAESYDRPV